MPWAEILKEKKRNKKEIAGEWGDLIKKNTKVEGGYLRFKH